MNKYDDQDNENQLQNTDVDKSDTPPAPPSTPTYLSPLNSPTSRSPIKSVTSPSTAASPKFFMNINEHAKKLANVLKEKQSELVRRQLGTEFEKMVKISENETGGGTFSDNKGPNRYLANTPLSFRLSAASRVIRKCGAMIKIRKGNPNPAAAGEDSGNGRRVRQLFVKRQSARRKQRKIIDKLAESFAAAMTLKDKEAEK